MSRFLLHTLAGAGLIASLAACSTPAGEGAPASSAAPSMTDAATMLTQYQWELVQWDGHPLPREGGQAVSLRFTARSDGAAVSGNAGCNRFNAGYSLVAPDGIAIGTPAATRMACPGAAMQFEAAYLAALPAMRSYAVADRSLTLRDARGAVQRYRASPATGGAIVPPAAPVQVTELYVAPVRTRCTGVAPMQCLQVRREAKGPWELWYAPIAGFEFRTGIAYRIRIIGTPVVAPPADGSSISWTLDKILEQHRAGPRRKKPVAEKK